MSYLTIQGRVDKQLAKELMRQRFEAQVSTWLSRLVKGAHLFPGKSLSECHGEAQYKHNGVFEVRLSEEGGTAACVYKLSLLT